MASSDNNQKEKIDDSIIWNPYNQVVQSHRTGEVDYARTNFERQKRKLPIPFAYWEGIIIYDRRKYKSDRDAY